MRLGIDESDRDGRRAEIFEEAAPMPSSIAQMIGTKNLLIAIVTMPFVFLVVVMTIIGIFGRSDDEPSQVAENAVRSVPAETLTQPALASEASGRRAVSPIPVSTGDIAKAIEVPAGANIGAMSLDGDRLAVRVDSEDGAMIVIYDLAESAIIQTIPVVASTNP